MDEFLRVEYEQCLKLVTYYEDKQLSLVKFASVVSSAVISAFVGLSEFTAKLSESFWPAASLLGAITALALLAIFIALVQMRLYFLYPARQVNAIRQHELSLPGNTFSNNRMYLDPDFPAFKLGSASSVLLALVSLEVSSFVGLSVFCAMYQSAQRLETVIASSGVTLICAVGLFALAGAYLFERGSLASDRGVHRR